MSNNHVLNHTPIRTSISYKINDLTIKNLTLPTEMKKFEEISTSYNDKLEVSSKTPDVSLVYGAGEVLQDNMNEYCNSSYTLNSKEHGGEFEVTYIFDDNNTELSNYLEINADKDMNVTVIYRSKTELPCHHNFIMRTNVASSAKVHVEIVNLLNKDTNHFVSIENTVEKQSDLELVLVDMGAKYSVTNLYSNIVGAEANVNTNTIYIGQGEDVKDMNYIAHLRGEKCVADMELQGVLTDKSTKNLKFTIDFKTGCTGAKGRENESCMLLSDDASYRSLPILLCTEDDVEGAHSAAAGQVDPGQLFYIMSRGFEKKEAIKMLVKAKYNEITEKIIDEALRKEVLEEIDRRL